MTIVDPRMRAAAAMADNDGAAETSAFINDTTRTKLNLRGGTTDNNDKLENISTKLERVAEKTGSIQEFVYIKLSSLAETVRTMAAQLDLASDQTNDLFDLVDPRLDENLKVQMEKLSKKLDKIRFTVDNAATKTDMSGHFEEFHALQDLSRNMISDTRQMIAPILEMVAQSKTEHSTMGELKRLRKLDAVATKGMHQRSEELRLDNERLQKVATDTTVKTNELRSALRVTEGKLEESRLENKSLHEAFKVEMVNAALLKAVHSACEAANEELRLKNKSLEKALDNRMAAGEQLWSEHSHLAQSTGTKFKELNEELEESHLENNCMKNRVTDAAALPIKLRTACSASDDASSKFMQSTDAKIREMDEMLEKSRLEGEHLGRMIESTGVKITELGERLNCSHALRSDKVLSTESKIGRYYDEITNVHHKQPEAENTVLKASLEQPDDAVKIVVASTLNMASAGSEIGESG